MSGFPGAYVTFWEDFLTDNVTDLNETVGSSAVQDVVSGHGGWWRQSNDGGDADDCDLIGELAWEVDEGQPITLETRVKNDQAAETAATGSGIFFGMTDATTESNGINPLSMEAATFTSTATDAFGMIIDECTTSGTTDLTWHAVAVDTGVDETPVALTAGADQSAGVWQVIRMVATAADSGTVLYYIGTADQMGGGKLVSTQTGWFDSSIAYAVALGSDDRGDDADTDWDYIYVSAMR